MLALLAVGGAARSAGVLAAERRDRLNALAYYVALPALVFHSTHHRPLGEVFTPTLIVGLWAVLLAMVGLSLVVHRDASSGATWSVATIQSYHCNLGYLGLPMVAATFGGLAAARGSLLLGVGALTQIPLTIFLLVTPNDAAVEVRAFIGNPIVLSLPVGLAVAGFGVPVPGSVTAATGLVSELALPVALVCVGASLDPRRASIRSEGTPSVAALKLLVMPALALVAFAGMGADQATLRAGVLMLGMPTAVSTFVYATEHGDDERLAPVNVPTTTVLSAGTLYVLVRLLA
ncbi:malonate transporter [Halobacteriales archaeon QS_1_68_20]|nr:MAG: malonate transporter [Halobacteriales archaeon QS_1_68_20]